MEGQLHLPYLLNQWWWSYSCVLFAWSFNTCRVDFLDGIFQMYFLVYFFTL